MASSTIEKLTAGCARYPGWTLLVWLAGVGLAAFLITHYLSGALTTAQEFTNAPESQQASELVNQYFPNRPPAAELVIVDAPTLEVTDPQYRQFVTALIGKIAANEHVAQVVNFYQIQQPYLVSTDKRALLIPVTLKGEVVDQEKNVTDLLEIARSSRTNTFDVKVTGPAAINRNFSEVSEKDLRTGELYGLPISFVILAVVFGAMVAAFVPLILSLIAITLAVGTTAIVGTVGQPFSFFVVNMITMMGLAVGIDYSLFVISRFREERQAGQGKQAAISRAGATAGRAVLFSGLTVVLALIGLFLIPMNIFQGLAAGAIFVVVFAIAAALTLLPALLSLLGDRINWLRVGPRRDNGTSQSGFWAALTQRIIARPVASLLLAAGILLLAAIPVLDLRIGASGISSMPENLEARQAYDTLKKEFSVGFLSPAFAVVQAPIEEIPVRNGVIRFQKELQNDPVFGSSVVQANEENSAALIQFQLNSDNTSETAQEAIGRLRNEIVPTAFSGTEARVLIGGEAANNYDFIATSRDHAIPVFVFVLGLSFILLMIVFRSIVVPLKAIVMNLLSVAAAYGLLVLVFQKGVGDELLGFQRVEKIEAWLPLFLFCILFGLSMDYHVFLLSRVRERFNRTGDNTEAVAFGVRTTAGIITGAALIMVAVFAAFAAGDLVMFQQMGFGMAVAILIDATIVRSFLVPASMRLLGERNWYLPPFLRWLPRVSVESES